MQNKDIERIRQAAIDAALTIQTDNRTRSVYSDGYKHGAMAEFKHLQAEIERLKDEIIIKDTYISEIEKVVEKQRAIINNLRNPLSIH